MLVVALNTLLPVRHTTTGTTKLSAAAATWAVRQAHTVVRNITIPAEQENSESLIYICEYHLGKQTAP
jgi:hypothetical protein